jgi:hypothetical protein
MKILIYTHKPNFIFNNLVQPLINIGNNNYIVGHAAGQISEDDIKNFSPDIIIHNIEGVKDFPVDGLSCISIPINEQDCRLESFVTLDEFESNNPKKYESDAVYIGDPSVFGDNLFKLSHADFLFKFLHPKPAFICGYAGACNLKDRLKFYRYSKACIITPEDNGRKFDILYAGGNPVINDENLIENIQAAINGKKFTVDIDREEVLNNHTNYDMIRQIFKTVGLTKIAKDIESAKLSKLRK